MNETMKVILNRRSTRSFLEKQIKDEELNAVVEAGKFAPSGMNLQPWHFTVIQNKDLLNELTEAAKEALKYYNNPKLQDLIKSGNFHAFYKAPTAILVSGDESSPEFDLSCAAAMENMAIAAESLGIGASWVSPIGLFLNSEKGKEYRERLGIPEGYKPFKAIVLGYKKENVVFVSERKENTVNYIK